MAASEQDRSEELLERVRLAADSGTPLCIEGGATKTFLGRLSQGEPLSVAGHEGITSYEPSELVVTARTGTPLSKLKRKLAASGQMLAFDPPGFGKKATLGGTIACGLSGPRRPYTGAARDFVLGIKMLNGKGEFVSFGGQVMKNVAGYDLSRLMVGAMGTLGVMLEASLKVLPLPKAETTLIYECGASEALTRCSQWQLKPLPISAAAHHDGLLRVRLSGTEGGVKTAQERMGGEVEPDSGFWEQLAEQRLDYFGSEQPLWRLSLPPAAPMPDFGEEALWLVDWGGAQRWLLDHGNAGHQAIRAQAEALGGHATLFRYGDRSSEVHHPLQPGVMRLHQRLKEAFDPHGLFNPGRLYAGV